MKKIFLKIGNGMLMGIGFIVIVAIAFYSVKARTGTTSSSGDKLTSAKRNELVASISGVQSTIPKARSVSSTSYINLPASSATWQDIPGFTQTITLDKASKVLISGMGDYYCPSATCHIYFNITVDSVQSKPLIQMGNGTNMRRNTWGINHFINLSAGSHIIKIQTHGGGGTGGEANVCGYISDPNRNCTMHIMAFPN